MKCKKWKFPINHTAIIKLMAFTDTYYVCHLIDTCITYYVCHLIDTHGPPLKVKKKRVSM